MDQWVHNSSWDRLDIDYPHRKMDFDTADDDDDPHDVCDDEKYEV